MSRLIRMDSTGHSTLAEWTTDDQAAFEVAVQEFRRQLDDGYIGVVDEGPGRATQVRDLPREAALVIMRRPIAGGGAPPYPSSRQFPGARGRRPTRSCVAGSGGRPTRS